MRIPTDKHIRALHEKHAPTWAAFDRVYSHCEIVCAIAEQLLARAGSVFSLCTHRFAQIHVRERGGPVSRPIADVQAGVMQTRSH